VTANRYRRPAERRTLEDVADRLSPLEFGNPLPTFRAAISGNSTNLRDYDSDATVLDTVFWDHWDPTYDSRFFDPFIQPSGPDAGRLGAVELLVNGLYGIHASIDWDDFFDANVRVGSNYDDGGIEHWYREATWFYGPETINHFRILWNNQTSSERFIEIVVGHDDPTLASHTIPGGFNGAWAIPPMLTIVYLGGIGTEANFFLDVM
jgi:hypothetical protein